MYMRNVFKNISPLDHRYSLREEEFEKYTKYFSEEARVKYHAKIEATLVKTLADYDICSEKVAEEVEKAAEKISVEDVYEEEKKTRHDIRALVNCLQRRVSEEARPYIHFTTTSYDIVDTATALRYKEATEELIIPLLIKLEKLLMNIAIREKDTVQIGRTHGQHAIPLTFGFTIAGYVSRLGGRIEKVQDAARELRGKISGAVGAYNASHLFFSKPEEFEASVLEKINLKPSPHSTQIVEAEYMTDYLHALVSLFSVLANLSDDMRHLQRTEISEVGEYFAKDQVGSSTMPHKRNPINYENVKSMWKKFMPGMMTIYMDQISEHQRDLSNSASARFIPEIIIGLLLSVNRLIRVSEKMMVDRENLKKNFEQSKDMIIAEPLYILLASYGHPDAHEAVRKLTLDSEKTGMSLEKLIKKDDKLKVYRDKFTDRQWDIIRAPENYIGIAPEKTVKLVNYWKEKLNIEE